VIVEGDAPDERGLVHDEALRREDDAIGRQIHDRPFLNGDVADFFAALLIAEGLPLRVGVARSKTVLRGCRSIVQSRRWRVA